MNATIIIYTYMATCTLVHGPLTFLNRTVEKPTRKTCGT